MRPHLLQEIEDGLQFLSLRLVGALLSEAELCGHEGVVHDVKDVAVVVLEEQRSLLGADFMNQL
jgi:hypothetical protein